MPFAGVSGFTDAIWLLGRLQKTANPSNCRRAPVVYCGDRACTALVMARYISPARPSGAFRWVAQFFALAKAAVDAWVNYCAAVGGETGPSLCLLGGRASPRHAGARIGENTQDATLTEILGPLI